MAPKRDLESEDSDVASPEQKRPRRLPSFASIIADAMRIQNLQKLLEPLIRRVVSEEIERAVGKLVPAKLRSSTANQIQGPELSRNLRLNFANKLNLPIFTGSRVEGEQSCPIQLVLLDTSTGQSITTGPESSQKVEIVVLEGDFGHDDDEDWTAEEFDNHVVREREGKRPLLAGNLPISLKDGVGTLGELTFTDNSSWIRSRKFRLGARVAGGNYNGTRIREAKTEGFTVKDHRGELYKKHYPPVLDDEVWRLDKVGKDGAFHKRLRDEQINTVRDFLRLFVTDSPRLRQILGNGMSAKMWEGTVEHAKTCILNNKYYVYDSPHNISLVFNVIYELVFVISETQTIPAAEISGTLKSFVERLAKHAYQHLNEVRELGGEILIGNASCSLTMQNGYTGVPQGPQDPNFQRTVLLQEQDGNAAELDHKSQIMGSLLMSHQQSVKQVNSDWNHPSDNVNIVASQVGTGFTQQNVVAHPVESSSLVLGSQQELVYPLTMAYPTPNSNSDIQRNGIRLQNAEEGDSVIIKNEWAREPREVPEGYYHTNLHNELATEVVYRGTYDEDFQVTQNWLPGINGSPVDHVYNFFPNMQGDQSFSFASLPPTSRPNFNMSMDRLHGKAYVGWLKLKAALKWGISVRKEAAAKRAILEDLED